MITVTDLTPEEYYSPYFVEKILNEYNNQQIKDSLEIALPKYNPTSRKVGIKKLALWYIQKWGGFKW